MTTTPYLPAKRCTHENFIPRVSVMRLVAPHEINVPGIVPYLFETRITVQCADCLMFLKWEQSQSFYGVSAMVVPATSETILSILAKPSEP